MRLNLWGPVAAWIGLGVFAIPMFFPAQSRGAGDRETDQSDLPNVLKNRPPSRLPGDDESTPRPPGVIGEIDREPLIPLPFTTPPDAKSQKGLGTVTRERSGGVVLLGYEKDQMRGTGWVLSRKHRLVVTNAHVADIMYRSGGKMYAIASGTSGAHKVEQVWYHPGVRRRVADGKLSIRSECPADGGVAVVCPDLAILQLGEGPDLESEMVMATPEELGSKALQAQTVGMYGFPGYGTDWPELGKKIQGVFLDGVISHMTNFRSKDGGPDAELQFVQHTLQGTGGFSGSPIYLPNGHVVAVHNSFRAEDDRGAKATLWFGVRIDCLWEMLVHHGLDKKVPVPIDKSKLLIERWKKIDPEEKKFRHAVKMVEDACFLIDVKRKYMDGIQLCEEAMDLYPDYPDSYRVRAAALNNYYAGAEIKADKGRILLNKALEDAKTYQKLMSADPRGLALEVQTRLNKSELVKSPSGLKQVLEFLDKAVESKVSATQLAEFYSLRGACRQNLGNSEDAIDDYNKSIKLDDKNDILYENRARYFEAVGLTKLAAKDMSKAKALRREAMERRHPDKYPESEK